MRTRVIMIVMIMASKKNKSITFFKKPTTTSLICSKNYSNNKDSICYFHACTLQEHELTKLSYNHWYEIIRVLEEQTKQPDICNVVIIYVSNFKIVKQFCFYQNILKGNNSMITNESPWVIFKPRSKDTIWIVVIEIL